MEKKIFFMPLGGGQSVGASCYYLKLGSNNIILDAGIGINEGLVIHPDLYSLEKSAMITSINQISQIFISHAHADHIGYLLDLMRVAPHATVYMTELTAVLTKYQLYDRNYIFSVKHTEEDARLAAQYLLDKVVIVNYQQTIDFGNYKVTFYPAGHIPGAMMTLFEYGRRKILYTGDFSLKGTDLTDGCCIPSDKKIDTLIMCGLHAKHPKYIRSKNDLLFQVDKIMKEACVYKKSVMCHISQLSKGVELLKALEKQNNENIPIYIDNNLMQLIERLERLSICLLSSNVHMEPAHKPENRNIMITSCMKSNWKDRYEHKRVDFSLHEDFGQMKEFIKKINPANAYLVHCAKELNSLDDTVEQEMMRDADCRTQFVFAEEQEIYQI